MKRRFFALFAALLLFCLPASASPEGEYVRLHVIANSDSDEDQALKLIVRDAVLCASTKVLEGASDADEAYRILEENLARVEASAAEAARGAGFSGAVRAEIGVFAFPDRVYGDTLVPAGDYRAVRVLLGEGEGKNWWCVLYPTLCAIDENGEFAKESAEIVFYSSLGRWITSILEGDSR